nr:reverse transcriptase domain-containing protein [Tanacetum cinerariifolium]
APPSPDYIPGPEELEQAPPSPDYVTGPEHADDEIVTEDQLYAEDASPTAQLPEYVPESDLEAHPEDDDDEDPEEDPVDYPTDGEDDGDDEEGSSDDDEGDDIDSEADEEEEEEEHPAPADYVVVASTAADQASSAEETKPFETDESAATPPLHPAYRMTARISIPAPVPMPAWSDSEIVRLLAMSSLPASPLSPWSSPLPQIPFPPLPPILSPPSPVPTRSLGYRATKIRLRAEAASTSHSPPLPPPFILSPTRADEPSSGTPLLLPISASTSSPPLQLPSASRREDRPEVTLPPRKRLGITLGLGYKVGESSSAAAARPAGGLRAYYVFVATMDREIMCDPKREVSYGITDSQDTDEIYMRLDDEQTERQLLAGRLNMLFRDRRAYAYTRHLMETEARLSREAWVRSTNASDLVCSEVMSLRTIVLGQMTEIRELHVADHRRQIGHVIALQAQVTALQGQQGLAGGLTQPELPEEAETNGTKRTTRSTADQGTINTTSVTNAQLQAMIEQGVTATLAARDALRSTNGDDSHNSGTGELALLCGRMFSEESDKIEKYIGGLPDMIHGSVVASKPKTMQEAVEITTELMDKKIRTFAERETASKRKFKNTSRNTQNQQQQSNKRQNTGQVYTIASGEKKQYGGSKPLCTKFNYHHDEGHWLGQKTTCYKCGVQGHFKREYPKLKNNNNHGNQGGRNNAPARVYTVGRAGIDLDANVVTDLMPVELGSFDAIIGMDWLAKYQAVIACAEKIVRVPWGNETLIIHGDGSNQENATRLSIISCTKTEKYMMKGFPIFLAHITTKEVETSRRRSDLRTYP